MSKPAIQIVGAGLTGMSAAKHLDADYEIHERLTHPGGHAITLKDQNYRFDRTGHLLHLRDPEITDWVSGLLGKDTLQIQRRSKVFSHGGYTRYPYQANTFGLPPQVAYECLTGFLKALEVKDSVAEPKNFEEFCLKHFGEGFSKHFMIPYNSKIWGVHPREITAAWCQRFVPMPKLEDVIAGAVGMNDRELGYNTNFVYPKLGIGELSRVLAEPIMEKINFSSAPVAVDYKKRQLIFSEGTRDYEVLISTAPLDVLISLLKDPPSEVINAAKQLRCNPLRYLDVALDKPCGVDLHWAYVPEDRYPFYRVGCYSNFSEQMAPAGKSCLYVELSSREEPDLDNVMPEISQGLIDMQIIDKASDIAFVRARYIEHAYVIFDHNYYRALEVIRPFLEEQRIISAGRYGDWNYSSMEDALLFGRRAAEKAKELVK